MKTSDIGELARREAFNRQLPGVDRSITIPHGVHIDSPLGNETKKEPQIERNVHTHSERKDDNYSTGSYPI